MTLAPWGAAPPRGRHPRRNAKVNRRRPWPALEGSRLPALGRKGLTYNMNECILTIDGAAMRRMSPYFNPQSFGRETIRTVVIAVRLRFFRFSEYEPSITDQSIIAALLQHTGRYHSALACSLKTYLPSREKVRCVTPPATADSKGRRRQRRPTPGYLCRCQVLASAVMPEVQEQFA